MARFNPETYNPRNDSSPGAADYYAESDDEPGFDPDSTVVLVVGPDHLCQCGCGREPLGSKSEFLMGHDATLKGKLQRAHRTGTEVAVAGGGMLVSGPAAGFAAERGWSHLMDVGLVGKTVDVKIGRWIKTVEVLAVNEDGTLRVRKDDGSEVEVKASAVQ